MVDGNIDYLGVLSDIFRIDKIIFLVFLFLGLYLITRLIKMSAQQFSDKMPTKKNSVMQIAALINFFVNLGGGSAIIYLTLSPPREIIIAFLGSATVAVGLSLKDTVGSLISGITIIADPPFRIGDRIYFKTFYGEVKHIGLRSVRILTVDDQIVTIPNASFMTEAVVCQNPGRSNINIVTPFFMNISVDVEQVKAILTEVVYTSRYVYLDEPIIIVVEQATFADVLASKFLVKAHVNNALYEREFQTDLYARGIKAFIDKGIPLAHLYKPPIPPVPISSI